MLTIYLVLNKFMKGFIETYLKRPIKRIFHLYQSQAESIKLKSPAKNMKLIAVTGTSGKSSTATMIYHVLNNTGFKVGLISTVEAIAGNKKIDTGLHVTTPDAKELQQILRKMKDEGMEYVVLETSSHAIDQGRLGFLALDYAVYTNIKRDHLDWHGSWENYAKAKAGIINKLKSNGKAIVNKDDKKSYDFLRHYYYSLTKNPKNFIEYSKSSEVTKKVEMLEGLSFIYKKTEFKLPVVGEYNIDNALATIKVAESLHIEVSRIAEAFKTFKGVKGRMEIMKTNPFMVIVDFAHNADSLEKSLASIRNIKGVNKIISVFGSAGLRDIEKRFTMGEIAAKYSDIVIVTSEDPRIEKLFDINSRIIEGANKAGGNLVKRFANHQEYLDYDKVFVTEKGVYAFDEETTNSRFDAIDFGIKIANPGDVVIIEGKGHEQSLCFGTTEYPFSDQDAVRKSLKI